MFLHVEYVIIYKKKSLWIIMNYNCPRQISEYLLCSSLLIGITSAVSFYNKDYITFIFIFTLFITSINFWRNPQYSIRRTVDMTMCKLLGLYFFISSISFHEFNRVLYECIVLVFIMYNIIENVLWLFNNNQWVIFHMAIHIYTFYFTIFIYYVL